MLDDGGVVNNGLFVAAELGEAVCAVVEGLDVVGAALGVLHTVLDFICVVLDGQFKSFKFSVD